MSHALKRERIGSGVYFSSISDPKFKHNRISVNFITELDHETASENAILSSLLTKGCKSCPDFTKLERKLCSLYGASLDADVSKFGQYQIISVSLQSVDNRYALESEDLVGECARLLCDIAFDPNINNGAFPAEDLELEKQFLLDTIAADINDKRTYALGRCKTLMCEGESIAVRKYGDTQHAEKITAKSAAKAYERLASNAMVEIMFIGSGNPCSAKDIFADRLANRKCDEKDYSPAARKTAVEKVREFSDQMEVSQGKLVMGFRAGDNTGYRELAPMRMMAALYGGTTFSRLFIYVREKLSLCYYCAARFDISTGILTVDSGVEFENRQKALDEILRQLKIVQNGEFEDEEFENTKLAMSSALCSATDSLGAIESWYMTQIFMGSAVSPQEEAEALINVTKEQLVAAANEVTLDTVYFLEGKGEVVSE